MIFWVNSLQPVAGATSVVPCVQLPKAGRIASSLFEAIPGRTLPATSTVALRGQQRGHLGRQQGQYRAQCRANCMSKANF
ncbi:hypothetical protein GCM10022409_30550 [Hymenobacter glaciei]|uniref:Uncharacterized protein n=1 Tax=Hymenobacter glaciei TaxID=877209 RepID=A0ABP7UG35_9BACT